MLRVENNLNKMAYLMFALRCFDVSGFLHGLEPFRRVLLSGGLLPLKRNERRATHWPEGPHSKLRKFHKNGLPYVCIALFLCLCVPEGIIKPFGRVRLSHLWFEKR